jgi:hypothetical protein
VEVIAVSRRVQTLLFTDIVGSTDRLRDLGDAAWAALLVRHHEVIRAALAAHGGREVDTAGDGLLARFDAPAPALHAAVAALAAVAPLRIEIRAGLHTGEVELHGDVMTGIGVHLVGLTEPHDLGKRWLGEVLTERAWAAARSRDTYLAAQYWRLARRIGKKKAAMAVGHSILVIAWHLLANDCDYQDLGGDFFVRRDADRARQRAVAQFQALGYRVTLEPLAA